MKTERMLMDERGSTVQLWLVAGGRSDAVILLHSKHSFNAHLTPFHLHLTAVRLNRSYRMCSSGDDKYSISPQERDVRYATKRMEWAERLGWLGAERDMMQPETAATVVQKRNTDTNDTLPQISELVLGPVFVYSPINQEVFCPYQAV